ncbi:MAG: hypothetical protein Q4D51_14275 [Eubacteriales bacterium]|nr:hypothetical protein [Eubacteriales bacterium]
MENLELFDISIEEFDNMNEKHTFSKRYLQNKKRLMKNYRKSMLASHKTRYVKVAVAFTVLVIASPLIVNAATNGELFARIWGTQGRSDVKTHEEVVYSEDKNKSFIATYPQREYEDIDEEKAKELIGDQVTYESMVQEIDGTTLTICSAVRDRNAAVVEFTLEKEGGVDALNYSQVDNEAKGAWFSDEATFYIRIGDGGEHIFVDLSKSTEDKLYCYDYMTLDSVSNSIPMEITEYPCTRGEYINANDEEGEEIARNTVRKNISIPVSEIVDSVEYINPGGGVAEISPLSIKLDMAVGLGLSDGEAYDPFSCYKVEINYKDGSSYLVKEHSNSKHSCDVEIDNTSYARGGLETDMTYVFNRLVDVNEISSITINDVEYAVK